MGSGDIHLASFPQTRLLHQPVLPKPNHADRGVVDLWKAIKPLTTIASAMNTGAHPDDEHSAMLAYLSLGKGVNTSSIIATRGEGGQNEIGSELGNALGVIRTRELEVASKLSNVTLGLLSEQINDPINDFGFSKCAKETFQKWGESVCYERLVRKIRELRPDVLIPCFLNEPTTHGHHRAITILTYRAYRDAANPNVFPEQLQNGLYPWQVKKLYVPVAGDDYTVGVPVGEFNQNYGASYLQLGEESRFMHKSQGMGVRYEEGPTFYYYKLEISTIPAAEQETDFFEGIAFTFADLAKEVAEKDPLTANLLETLHEDAAVIIEAFPNFTQVACKIHEMKADIETAIERVAQSDLDEVTKIDLLYRLCVKEEQLNKASMEATSLVLRLKPEDGELVPGQTTRITVSAYNGGENLLYDVKFKLYVPDGWQVTPLGVASFNQLCHNETVAAAYEIVVPLYAGEFQPYEPSVVQADVSYRVGNTESTLRIDPEVKVAVLPPFSLSFSPAATVLNTLKTDESIPIKVTVTNYLPEAVEESISLQVPDGWCVQPQSVDLSFSFKAETKSAAFTVTPASALQNGKYTICASVGNGKFESGRDVQVIDYPHIGRSYFIKQAELQIQAFDLQVPNHLRVGYVSSGFDNIDSYLREVGVDVINLDSKELQCGDLTQYDTIVLGIRAYAFRPELICSNQRLLQYVENGGNLVAQYHKPEDKWKPDLAPYPIWIGESLIDWRVTNENSQVTVLEPNHRIFNWPNQITDDDWQNWVQERSIYNPAKWSEEYTELISTGDPGEKEFTGIFLTAAYGRGTYTYSSLSWFREIPHLVPGAIRMFVNMISLKQ